MNGIIATCSYVIVKQRCGDARLQLGLPSLYTLYGGPPKRMRKSIIVPCNIDVRGHSVVLNLESSNSDDSLGTRLTGPSGCVFSSHRTFFGMPMRRDLSFESGRYDAITAVSSGSKMNCGHGT
jgi:hypothetical protein